MEGYNDIQISPELLTRYADSTKNEILLHLAIKSIASEGKVKRNINHIAVSLGKCPKRLREAESRLKQRGLLRVHILGGKRHWYIYDEPIGKESIRETIPIPTTNRTICPSPKLRSLWHTIRQVFSNRFTPLEGKTYDHET